MTLIKNTKPIFIVGCPRSGTTLLASRLNLHSQIAVSSETHFFEILNNFFLINVIYPLTYRGIHRLLFYSQMKDLKIDFNDFIKLFNQTEKQYINVFDISMDLYRSKVNKKYWCEKTPQHLKHLSNIYYYYPNAKVICILRDGRDVALSLSKAPWHENNIAMSSLEWNENIKYLNQANSKYSKEKFFVLKFEQFIENPQDSLKSICNFIGVNFESNLMTTPSKKPDLVAEWEINWKGNVMKAFDNSKIGKWHHQTTDYQKKLMNSIMQVNLHKMKYYDIEISSNKLEKLHINVSIFKALTLKPILNFIGKYSKIRYKRYHPF